MKQLAERAFWMFIGFIIGFLTAIGGLFVYVLPRILTP